MSMFQRLSLEMFGNESAEGDGSEDDEWGPECCVEAKSRRRVSNLGRDSRLPAHVAKAVAGVAKKPVNGVATVIRRNSARRRATK